MAKPVTITDQKQYKKTHSVVITGHMKDECEQMFGKLTYAVLYAHSIGKKKGLKFDKKTA